MEQVDSGHSGLAQVIKKRKSKIDIDTLKIDLVISTDLDYQLASNVSERYKAQVAESSGVLEKFKKLGAIIGDDLQFMDDGSGSGRNTIAGQLKHNVLENRDCKLPTFLLALAIRDISPEAHVSIVYVVTNPAHPYVQLSVDGQNVFGHFVRASLDDVNSKSRFELLSAERCSDLERYISRDRTKRLAVNLDGMKEMDKLFLDS